MSEKRPVLPPKPEEASKDRPSTRGSAAAEQGRRTPAAGSTSAQRSGTGGSTASAGASSGSTTSPTEKVKRAARRAVAGPPAGRSRQALLRLTRVDPWSVMKTAFLLAVVAGIVMIISVAIIWAILGAAGVWDSINSMLGSTLGSSSNNFDITDYIGFGRVLGFTMLVAVVDVVLLTALATLAAFVYNLAATLVGGVEMTLTEDR